jgi:hypothetical protein
LTYTAKQLDRDGVSHMPVRRKYSHV